MAERADHEHLVTHLKVAQVVGTHARHRPALVVDRDALDRDRDVVVAGPLAVARAGHRVLARHVRPAARVRARRHDADGLAFEHRKRHLPEVEHDVVGVAGRVRLGDAPVADHGGGDRALGAVEVGVGVGGRPRRHDRAGGRRDGRDRLEHRAGRAAGGARRALRAGRCGVGAQGVGAAACGRRRARQGGGIGVAVRRRAGGRLAQRGAQRLALGQRPLGRQFVPQQLLVDRVGVGAQHDAPVVDRAGRARRHARHAAVAHVGAHHVVAVVVRDRVDRAGRLAGVAADADFRVDQVLAQHRCIGGGDGVDGHGAGPGAGRQTSGRTGAWVS